MVYDLDEWTSPGCPCGCDEIVKECDYASVPHIPLMERLRKDFPNLTSKIGEVRGTETTREPSRFIEIFSSITPCAEAEYNRRMKRIENICDCLDELGYRGYRVDEFNGVITFLAQYNGK